MPIRFQIYLLLCLVVSFVAIAPSSALGQHQRPGFYSEPMRPAYQGGSPNGLRAGPPGINYPAVGWQSNEPDFRTARSNAVSGVGHGGQQITTYQNPSLMNSSLSALVTQMPPSLAGDQGSNATSEPDKQPSSSDKDSPISVGNLLQLFHDGGLMMYPIALSSMICLVFVFERLIFLRRGRVIPRPFVKRLLEQLELQQLDRDEVLELCEKNPSSMSTIIVAATKKYGRPAVEVEQAALDAGERVSNQLRKHLRIFSSISNLSPLFGLLGTVLGMIQTFNAIAAEDAMGRPQLLAGGISQAMLSTAAGLIVAIPAYIAYTYFVGHTDRLVIEMDGYAQQLVEVISAEGLQDAESPRSRSRSKKAA